MTHNTLHKKSDRQKFPIGKILRYIIPTIVSIGLCVVMFRDIPFGEMIQVIRENCKFGWIGLMLTISIISMILRGIRWGIQLRALNIDAPLHALILSIFGTYAVNIVFPRLGEVWRTGYIANRQKAPFSEVFGSMIADRMADLITVGFLTIFTLIVAQGAIVDFISTYPYAYRAIANMLSSPFFWCAAAAAGCMLWWIIAHSNNRVALKLRSFIKGLWEGIAALGRMKQKWLWLLLTVCIWGCYFIQLVVAFKAFSFTNSILQHNGLTAPLVCFVLTSISMGIPSNGGIGPYQTAMLFGLALFIPATISQSVFFTSGAAFGNLLITSQTLLMIVLGIITFVCIAFEKRRTKGKKCASNSPGQRI